MTKRILSVLLVVAMLAALLVGCGNADSSSDASASASASADANASSNASDSANEGTSGEPYTIRVTYGAGECFPEICDLYAMEHEGITVEIVTMDNSKLMSMIAAGTAPDIIRTLSAQVLPSYVTRGLAHDGVEDWLKNNAEFIDLDDLMPVNDLFRFDTKTMKQGEGTLYGVCKDFSPDEGFFINKKLFEEANVEVPAYDTAWTYTEVAEYAKKLAKVNAAGETEQFGMVVSQFDPTMIMVYAAQKGESPWSEDFTTSKWATTPGISEYLEWAIDLAKTPGASASPINLAFNSNDSGTFLEGKAGIFKSGYWYSGNIRSNENSASHVDDFQYMPGAVVNEGDYLAYCTSGTGAIVLRQTKNFDETMKFFDYFHGGQPATDRALSGWGLPAFKSLMDLLPAETEFDKQAKEVAMAQADAIQPSFNVNPYINFDSVWAQVTANIIPLLSSDDVTLADALAKMDEEFNVLIQEGMEIAGVGVAE